eukprot:SAG31_NODE_2437_length_5696_cov_2.259067_1_plen_265_part_00
MLLVLRKLVSSTEGGASHSARAPTVRRGLAWPPPLTGSCCLHPLSIAAPPAAAGAPTRAPESCCAADPSRPALGCALTRAAPCCANSSLHLRPPAYLKISHSARPAAPPPLRPPQLTERSSARRGFCSPRMPPQHGRSSSSTARLLERSARRLDAYDANSPEARLLERRSAPRGLSGTPRSKPPTAAHDELSSMLDRCAVPDSNIWGSPSLLRNSHSFCCPELSNLGQHLPYNCQYFWCPLLPVFGAAHLLGISHSFCCPYNFS